MVNTAVIDNGDGTRTTVAVAQAEQVLEDGTVVTIEKTVMVIETVAEDGTVLKSESYEDVREISRVTPQPEPTPEPQPEPQPEPEIIPQPEPTPEPEVIPQPEPTPEPEVIPQPETPVVVTVEKPVEEQVIAVAAPRTIVRGMTGSTRAPQTGDESNVMLYLCMMMLSAAGLIVCGRKVRA